MALNMRPFRSVLYLPGSNDRALNKARSLATDALIFDLEDAVAPSEKLAARKKVRDAVAAGGFENRFLMVRINALDTEWGEADVAALGDVTPDAILLPKVNSPEDIAALCALMDRSNSLADSQVWAMMETPQGILNAGQTAAAPGRLAGLVMGTNDLAKDIGAAATPDRQPMLFALSQCILAARANGLVVVDGVYNQFRDDDGLRAECMQGRDLGFDGKTLIHPAQLAITNEVFAPSEEELDLAREFVAAFDEALAEGKAVAVVRGRIVENLHVETARALLAKAEAIARLEAA